MGRDLVQEEPHAGEAEGHGVLVAGGHERGGAVGRVGLQQFEGAAEMADVGMGIDESGRHPPAAGVDDPGLVATGVISAGAHVTDAPLAHGHLHAVQHLAGVDVDQAPAGDQQVSLDLTHAGAYQALDRVSGLPHVWTSGGRFPAIAPSPRCTPNRIELPRPLPYHGRVQNLVLRNIGKRFGQVTAVDDFDLAVDQGEFLVIIGEAAAARPRCCGSSPGWRPRTPAKSSSAGCR